MEDLLPLLVFAIISAISHLVNKRKESREEVTWEQLEEMQNREGASQDAGPAGPPPIPAAQSPDSAPNSALEEFERMIREVRSGSTTPQNDGYRGDSPTTLPPESSRPETPAPALGGQDLSMDDSVFAARPAVNEALELARAENERARKDLEAAREKADHIMEKAIGGTQRGFISGLPTAPASAGGLWGNHESVRQAFIASVVFDRPLAYKPKDTETL